MIPYAVDVWIAQALFDLGPKLYTLLIFGAGVGVGYALRSTVFVGAPSSTRSSSATKTRS